MLSVTGFGSQWMIKILAVQEMIVQFEFWDEFAWKTCMTTCYRQSNLQNNEAVRLFGGTRSQNRDPLFHAVGFGVVQSSLSEIRTE